MKVPFFRPYAPRPDKAASRSTARHCVAALTFNDRTAAQVLSAFAIDTELVLAHIDIAEKSNEILAAQALLAELGVTPLAIATLDTLHCQKNICRRG